MDVQGFIDVMNVIIRIGKLTAKGDDAGDALGVGAAANDHGFMRSISGHLHIGPIEILYKRGIFRIEQRFGDMLNFDTSLRIFQMGGRHSVQLFSG